MHFCILIVNFSHELDFSFDIFPFGLSSFSSWKKNKIINSAQAFSLLIIIIIIIIIILHFIFP